MSGLSQPTNKPITEFITILTVQFVLVARFCNHEFYAVYFQKSSLGFTTGIIAFLNNIPYTAGLTLLFCTLVVFLIWSPHSIGTIYFLPPAILYFDNIPHQFCNFKTFSNADVTNLLLFNCINKVHPPMLYMGLSFIIFMYVFSCKRLQGAPYRPTKTLFFFGYDRYLFMRYNTPLLFVFNWLLFTFVLGSWWALQLGTWGGWWAWDISEILFLSIIVGLIPLVHLLTHKKFTKFCAQFISFLYIISVLVWHVSNGISSQNLHSFFPENILLVQLSVYFRLIIFLRLASYVFWTFKVRLPASYQKKKAPWLLIIILSACLAVTLTYNLISETTSGAFLLLWLILIILALNLRLFFTSGMWYQRSAHLGFFLFFLKILTSGWFLFHFSYEDLKILSLFNQQNFKSNSRFFFTPSGGRENALFGERAGLSSLEAEGSTSNLVSDNVISTSSLSSKTFFTDQSVQHVTAVHEDCASFIF